MKTHHTILVQITLVLFALLAAPLKCQSELLTFQGTAQDQFLGFSVSGAGDVDKDGVPDLIVGTPKDSTNGAGAGKAAVFSGKDGTLLHTFIGDDLGDQFGESVSQAGDVNQDGFADLIVGAIQWTGTGKGYARVFSGKDGAVIYTFTGATQGSLFGRSVDTAGDVDNDGYNDVIVGAPRDGTNGNLTGLVRVFSGKNGAVIHTLLGSEDLGRFGRSVSETGDVNGDGYADFLVGAWHATGLAWTIHE